MSEKQHSQAATSDNSDAHLSKMDLNKLPSKAVCVEPLPNKAFASTLPRVRAVEDEIELPNVGHDTRWRSFYNEGWNNA